MQYVRAARHLPAVLDPGCWVPHTELQEELWPGCSPVPIMLRYAAANQILIARQSVEAVGAQRTERRHVPCRLFAAKE